MILFVNINESTIELYTEEGCIKLPFTQAGKIYRYVEENSSILYVTNAVQTIPAEVIDMIRNMGIDVDSSVGELKTPLKEEKTYIHVAGEEIIPIDDTLRFRGHYDAHPLTEDLIQRIKDTPLLQNLIRNKKLELITTSERKRLEEERIRKEDEKLASILVDRDNMDEKKDHEDAEVIDFTSEAALGRSSKGESGASTMSELSELIGDL